MADEENEAKTNKATSRERFLEQHREQAKRSFLRGTEFLNEYKASRGCCMCGENTPAVLDFHHFGEKTRMVATMRKYSIKRMMAEIDNCVILCSNCHRKLHAGLIDLDYLSL